MIQRTVPTLTLQRKRGVEAVVAVAVQAVARARGKVKEKSALRVAAEATLIVVVEVEAVTVVVEEVEVEAEIEAGVGVRVGEGDHDEITHVDPEDTVGAAQDQGLDGGVGVVPDRGLDADVVIDVDSAVGPGAKEGMCTTPDHGSGATTLPAHNFVGTFSNGAGVEEAEAVASGIARTNYFTNRAVTFDFLTLPSLPLSVSLVVD